jgi:hypothetical protein
MASKAPTLRKGLTVEEVIRDSWLDHAQKGTGGYGWTSKRFGQNVAMVAAKAAVQALIDAVDEEERVTMGEMMYFFTQLSDIVRDIGRVAKQRMANGELQPTLLDKLVQ